MSVLLYSNSIISIIFSSLLAVGNLSALSVIATILGLAYSFSLAFFSMSFIKNKTQGSFRTARTLLSYAIVVLMIVFIMSRVSDRAPIIMDIILAVLWFILVITAFITLQFFSEKRVGKYFGFTVEKHKHSAAVSLLEWVDALVWAISHLMLLNLFVVQCYEIPSESMVPTFMIHDRVVSLKCLSGPKFPMSSVHLPRISEYKRGDVVVLKSPRYPDTTQAELRSITSQALYMLTFMQVNTNTDPTTGKPKADPLVKRIVGLPGERLMLVDGVLYAKKQPDADYHVVAEDAQYAQWNLNALKPADKQSVKNTVFSDDIYNQLLQTEAERKAVDFRTEYEDIEKILHSVTLQKENTDTTTDIQNFLAAEQYSIIQLFQDNDDIARRIATTNGGLTWLNNFSLSWADFWVSNKANTASLYELRNAQLSVLIKKTFARLILRNLQLFSQNTTDEQFRTDEQRLQLLQLAERYLIYVQLSDGRNMNEFPKDGYLTADQYFLMGDNRFNSLDMRHATKRRPLPLDCFDSLPLMYDSSLAPAALHGTSILGFANAVFWPFGRAKIVK